MIMTRAGAVITYKSKPAHLNEGERNSTGRSDLGTVLCSLSLASTRGTILKDRTDDI